MPTIGEKKVEVCTTDVPHFTVYLLPNPSDKSPSQVSTAFKKTIVGSNPRVIGVSQVQVHSEKIFNHTINVICTMNLDGTEVTSCFLVNNRFDLVQDLTSYLLQVRKDHRKPSPSVWANFSSSFCKDIKQKIGKILRKNTTLQ